MSFIRSSRKRTKKTSSDSSALSFDLITNLNYMAALATGDTPRDVIFEHVMDQPFETAICFKQVYLMTKKLGFEYSSSFQLVSQKAGAENVKSLLLRFAGSISSGESESEFLAQEAAVEREQYISRYNRAVETLQKWGDAYAALLVSATLIVVVALISTMMISLGTPMIIMLVGSVFGVTIMGVYVIYKSAPHEIKTYKTRRGPVERRRAVFLFYSLFPVGLISLLYMASSGSLGLGFLALGACLAPSAFYAYKDDSKVARIDQEISNFIRALGNISGSLGVNLSTSINKIDRRAMGASLEPYIKRLQARLTTQISPEVCWDRFEDEIGSELVSRTTTMFVDGTALGGSPEKVGEISSNFAMSVALLRAKRYVTALPFSFLVIPLHGAMTALLMFVLEIMNSFSARMAKATNDLTSQSGEAALSVPDLPVFQQQDMGLVSQLVLGTVAMLTISNSLAPKFALGGHSLVAAFYGSIMCIITGINLTLIPPIAARLLLT